MKNLFFADVHKLEKSVVYMSYNRPYLKNSFDDMCFSSHPMNSLIKLFQNPASGLGGDAVERILLTSICLQLWWLSPPIKNI